MDLDKKLKNIEFTSVTGKQIHIYLTDIEIEAIKQAFIDDGWKKHENSAGCIPFTQDKEQEATLSAMILSEMGFREPVMTQSEWEAKAIKDGWVKIPQVEVVTRYEANKKPEVIMVNGKEVMTGQQWYDKFREGLYRHPMQHYDDVIAAAKKAAGIK